MVKKIIAYFLIVFGALCFLLATGGGTMRMRNKGPLYHDDITEGIILALIIIALPIIGFFCIKYGMKLLGVDNQKT